MGVLRVHRINTAPTILLKKIEDLREAGETSLKAAVFCSRTATSQREYAPYPVCTCHMCSSGSLLPELFDELRAAFAEPGERIVDVLHGEHDA
jgi:hypothetical protein